MTIILFEDEHVPQLDPVALARPAFAISCGGYRLVDLVTELDADVRASVRPHLREIVAADFPALRSGSLSPPADPILLVNARLVPSAAAVAELKRVLSAGRAGMVRRGYAIAAGLLKAPPARRPDGEVPLGEYPAQLEPTPLEAELPLFEYPHDVVRHHATTMAANLARRLKSGEYREISAGVFAAPDVVVHQYVAIDASRGPIVIEAGATVGPFCSLSGPVYVGPGARVLEHAALRGSVTIGQASRVGGEVECSIIEPYTNKQHFGYLGHSYLGSWINLGAGTCNSDLKNTYGHVNMEYRGRQVATGMQFVGAMVGDYAKTAINTGIFTGRTVGVCSMLYGLVTTNVPSFVNYARQFGQMTEATLEVAVTMQRRMFARRDLVPRPCDAQLLQDLYALTAHERQMPGETISRKPLSL